MKQFFSKQFIILVLVFFIPAVFLLGSFLSYSNSIFQDGIYGLDAYFDEYPAVDTSAIMPQGVDQNDEFSTSSHEGSMEMFSAAVVEDEGVPAPMVHEISSDKALSVVASGGVGGSGHSFSVSADSVPASYFNNEQWEEHEQETYQRAARSVRMVFYVVLFITFLLSLLAAWFTLRPLHRALEQQKQFIANASHEIKTPLALMRSEIDLFQHQYSATLPQQDVLNEFVHNLKQDTDRLHHLSRRLLETARLDQSHKKVSAAERHKVQELESSVMKIVERYNQQCSDHQVIFDDSSHQGHVKLNQDRLSQALELLLENACSHTPQGTEVRVSLQSDSLHWKLVVADDGPGIPVEHRGRIFDRFYRADSSRHQEGTGLGLSIAKQLVEQDGGSIYLDDVEQGAQFTISYSLIV